MMLLKLAWRNLWRNRRRTVITIASVVMAVFLSVTMNSFQEGSWDKMLDNVIAQYNGYGQVHATGYWEDKSLNNAMLPIDPDTLQNKPANLIDLVPRLEAFALLSSNAQTIGARVVGMDPVKENQLTGIADKVVEGTYWQEGAPTLLMGKGLAQRMSVTVGDTIVLLGQGYHGANAVGKYVVGAIVKLNSPDLDKTLAMLPLAEAQYVFGTGPLVTGMVMHLEDPAQYENTIVQLDAQLPDHYAVMGWQELMPSLVEAIQADKAGNYIMQFIIYLVIVFGIFSTVLMMTAERQHEFGVLLAIGMKKWRLQVMVMLELLLLDILGVFIGIIAALPLVLYLAHYPITISGDMSGMIEEYGMEPVFTTSTEPWIFISQGWLMLVITLLIVIYPFVKIMRMQAVEAMRA